MNKIYKQLSDLFIKEFDFLTNDYNFIRKNTTFFKVINQQVIQVFSFIRLNPYCVTISIGFYSVYDYFYNLDGLKESNVRLDNFLPYYREWNPMDESKQNIIKDMKEVFIKEIIPYVEKTLTIQDLFETKKSIERKYKIYLGRLISQDVICDFQKSLNIMMLNKAYTFIPELKNMVSEEDLIDFKNRYPDDFIDVFPEMTESYIKIGDLNNAFKALDYKQKILIPSISNLDKDYRNYPDIKLNTLNRIKNRLDEIHIQKNAVINKDYVILNEMVFKAEQKTRDILAYFKLAI